MLGGCILAANRFLRLGYFMQYSIGNVSPLAFFAIEDRDLSMC